MIKIQVASDLHFECHADLGKTVTKELYEASKSSQVDLLVLAGDIISTSDYDTLYAIFKRFSDLYPDVVLVPGNHEFYSSSFSDKETQFSLLKQEISNLHILDNQIIKIKGQRILGGTGWFSKDPSTTDYHKKNMGDFRWIKDLEPKCYQKNKAFKNLMQNELCNDDLVISHHLPSYLAVAPQFKNDQLNRFFVNDMENIIKERQPKLWCFGHSHTPTKFYINKTMVISNPFGYPFEKHKDSKNFNSNLIIEI